ncbi:copper homeostasis periplasmic binding protein CopC [Rhodopila sp.]|uniref:copper homeostasis periplasmic binding protein CopC n=1 Tax=Rhodopila sp. TaxID=2480087 RepID=UPI002C4AF6D3|nr:copper homeostasis periplasmic binding protein CopC [Rhodopila sp.]HVZ07298.1 copper homeostasis periplasmic binding protein CopC [Rhodopila sp.]
MTRSPISTVRAAVFAGLSGLAVLPAAAWAHAMLQRASPAVGSTVRDAPAALTLTYSEAVEPRFSTVAVKDPSGARVDQGRLDTQQDGHVLVAPLKPLAPGVYTVEWHVTSVDTHKTSGHFSFTVEP